MPRPATTPAAPEPYSAWLTVWELIRREADRLRATDAATQQAEHAEAQTQQNALAVGSGGVSQNTVDETAVEWRGNSILPAHNPNVNGSPNKGTDHAQTQDQVA